MVQEMKWQKCELQNEYETKTEIMIELRREGYF